VPTADLEPTDNLGTLGFLAAVHRQCICLSEVLKVQAVRSSLTWTGRTPDLAGADNPVATAALVAQDSRPCSAFLPVAPKGATEAAVAEGETAAKADRAVEEAAVEPSFFCRAPTDW
jgi:hypothetical protein